MSRRSSDAEISKNGSPREASGEGETSPVASTDMSAADRQNQRLGLRLFFVYALFYGGFVLVNAFATEWSEWEPIEGLNLAVLWGFALILFAFFLALLYGIRCNPGTSTQHRVDGEQGR